MIKTIPGTDVPFTIKRYTENLGVRYSSVIVYLLEYDSFTSSEDEMIFYLNLYKQGK